MMSEEMMKQMPHLMSSAGHAISKPLTQGAMMAATGFAAGRGLLGASLAAGVAAGFLAHKYQKEIVEGLSKASGMGKDFALQQKENLNDLMAEAEEKMEGPSAIATPASEPPAA